MSQRIICPSCQQQLSVPEELIGKKGKCESCGHLFGLVPPPEGWNHAYHHGGLRSPAEATVKPTHPAGTQSQSPFSIMAKFLEALPIDRLVGGAIAMVAILLAVGFYNHGLFYALVGLFCLVVPATFCLYRLHSRNHSDPAETAIAYFACPLICIWSLLWLLGVVPAPLSGKGKQLPVADIHPVFRTKISGDSRSRPAIHVDILDDSEAIFFTAELYLAVQSSRFPSDTWVILPLNVGEFAGCRTRFVQLPFEVSAGDNVLFNLLDEDRLTAEQEHAVVAGCQATGYCLLVAGRIYCPEAASILKPAVSTAADLLGAAIINDVSLHHFKNLGTAEFIVPLQLPDAPQKANRLSVSSRGNHSPATLRIFGPSSPMPFKLESTSSF